MPKSLKVKIFGAKKFSQKDKHAIYGTGNPISLSASIEPAAIFTLRKEVWFAVFCVKDFGDHE